MSKLTFATFLITLDEYDDLEDEVNDLKEVLEETREDGSRKELKACKKKLKDKEDEFKDIKTIVNKQWSTVIEFVNNTIKNSESVDFYILTQAVGVKNKMNKINKSK